MVTHSVFQNVLGSPSIASEAGVGAQHPLVDASLVSWLSTKKTDQLVWGMNTRELVEVKLSNWKSSARATKPREEAIKTAARDSCFLFTVELGGVGRG